MDLCTPAFNNQLAALIQSVDLPPSISHFLAAPDPAEAMIKLSKLLVASAYKIREEAKISQADEELGGDAYGDDVVEMNGAVAAMKQPQVYTQEETERLDQALVTFNEIGAKKLKNYRTNTKLHSAECTVGDALVTVRVKAEVRAEPEGIVAYTMGHAPKYTAAGIEARSSSLGLNIIERASDHSLYAQTTYKFPAPLQNRDLCNIHMWRRLDNSTYFVMQQSFPHVSCPVTADFTRMTTVRHFMITKVAPRLSRVEMLCQLDMNGSVGRRLNRLLTVPTLTVSLLGTQRFFAATRSPDQYDEGDAKELGRLLFFGLKKHRKNESDLRNEVDAVIAKYSVLRACQAKHRILDEILLNVLNNKMLKNAFTVRSPLVALTGNEARRIGKSLANILLCSTTGEIAVDEWVITFPALSELADERPWFRHAFGEIATELLGEASFGVKFRACLGAGLSIMDLFSDGAVVTEYFITGENDAAWALLAMVGVNTLCQLGITIIQTSGLKKDKRKTMALEFLAVVAFLKPGIDAYRVSSGAEQQPGAPMSPMFEMTLSRCSELVFEALPGMVLQSVVLLRKKEKTMTAIGSLLISAASASMTSTTSFFDADVDPSRRGGATSEWFGLIPDQGRTLAFVNIFVMYALHVMAKGFSIALLAAVNTRWLLGFLLGDLGCLFAYKILMKDFYYFVAVPPSLQTIATLLMRTGEKIGADFMGSFLYRLPLMLGASYWLANLIKNQVAVFVLAYLYIEYAPEDDAKLGATTVWRISGGLVLMWAASFVYFILKVADPKYRWTLWSTQTGYECTRGIFLNNTKPEHKIAIFRKATAHWEAAIGAEVKAWTMANWGTWVAEKPSWFTERTISTVPDAYIPPEDVLMVVF
ncbi:hypothetical protein TeGR_g10861 [Tetraparma gracilis]|uniref:START domain-containing protein n=1 Tax=Tetraparma gracilis TaxID=2962635 RepID=A0ABQ6NA79_9STRA|nr:hypothetical protein TeGR_g10861 [Tetraparma gracilis]